VVRPEASRDVTTAKDVQVAVGIEVEEHAGGESVGLTIYGGRP